MIGTYERTPEIRAKQRVAMEGRTSWNKGLTKKSNLQMTRIAEKLSARLHGRKTPSVLAAASARKGRASWNKGLTKETDARVAACAENGRLAKRGKNPWNKGMKMSREYCQKLEAGKTAAYARGDYVRFANPTSLEYALQLLLESAGLEFEAQKQFGRYTVDAWVPSRHLVFEADNGYWHSLRIDQEQRDSYLIKAGAVAVIHLSDDDLAPWRSR